MERKGCSSNMIPSLPLLSAREKQSSARKCTRGEFHPIKISYEAADRRWPIKMQRRSWRVEILYRFHFDASGTEAANAAIEAGPIVKIVKIVFGAG